MTQNLYMQAKMAALEFLGCAGDKARDAFFAEISKIKKSDISALFDGKNVDYQYAVDWSDDEYGCGRKFVYVWMDDAGEIFYVGCGAHNRVYETVGRSAKFKERVASGNCKAYILLAFADSDTALEVETVCIQYTQMMGHTLVNSSKTLSKEQIRRFRLCEVDCADGMDEKTQYDFQEYCELKHQFSDVLSVMNTIVASKQ